MTSEFEIEKRCIYGKAVGIVQLSPTHLLWTPDSAGDGNELQVALTSIRQYQVSKAGSAKKAKIQLVCSDRDAPIRLDFGKNFSDRDAVRDVLNRLHAQDPQPQRAATSRGSAPRRSAAPAIPLSDEERRRRVRLLEHPEVLQLHARLVNHSRAVTDDQFWKGIKFRYKPNGERRTGAVTSDDPADVDGTGIQKGVPTHAFSSPGDGEDAGGIEPKNWADGIPSPAQRHKVFMLLPVAARAYTALVPKKMKESVFWTTLAKSSMARKLSKELRLKRNAATATEADAVFAEFHAGERVAAVRESKVRQVALCRELALHRFDDHRSAHVLEGHGATGDAPRSATRAEAAGRAAGDPPSSSNLRIMREVNRHGQLIVDGSCKRMRTAAGAATPWKPVSEERGVPLNDLVEAEQQRFATLSADTVQKATPVLDASNGKNDGVGVSDIRAFAQAFDGWEADTSAFKYPIASSGKTLVNLLSKMQP